MKEQPKSAHAHLLVPLTHMVRETEQAIEQFYWDGEPEKAKTLEGELAHLKGLQQLGVTLYPLF